MPLIFSDFLAMFAEYCLKSVMIPVDEHLLGVKDPSVDLLTHMARFQGCWKQVVQSAEGESPLAWPMKCVLFHSSEGAW